MLLKALRVTKICFLVCCCLLVIGHQPSSACDPSGDCCIVKLSGNPCWFDYPDTRTIVCNDTIHEVDVTCCERSIQVEKVTGNIEACIEAELEGRCIPDGAVYDPTPTVCWATDLMALYDCETDDFYWITANGGGTTSC